MIRLSINKRFTYFQLQSLSNVVALELQFSIFFALLDLDLLGAWLTDFYCHPTEARTTSKRVVQDVVIMFLEAKTKTQLKTYVNNLSQTNKIFSSFILYRIPSPFLMFFYIPSEKKYSKISWIFLPYCEKNGFPLVQIFFLKLNFKN